MSEEGVRKMLRNLQLQEQQKLVVDYKIQCYIMTYLSQVQYLVAVAPVYHFVWAIKNTKIAKNAQQRGKKGVKKPKITRTINAGHWL